MFFQFLKTSPLLDETSVQWIFDIYSWALRNFDAKVFFDETILVTPSNAHFPGRESSAEGMANLIFQQVRTYAGMQHWPSRLLDQRLMDESAAEISAPPRIQIEGPIRGRAGITNTSVDETQKLVITYRPESLQDPEVLIADFAHTLAHYLGTTAREAPPGGEENWPHVTELLAVFMGFGVMMANSANTTKIRSCSSCSGPAVERENFLSQYDITYALAIFSCLKGIPTREVVKQLKPSLRPFYKKAVRDVMGRQTQILRLQEFQE